MRVSTHDHTLNIGGPEPLLAFDEFWVDTKSPGDGRVYTVGTIEVANTLIMPIFSNSAAIPAGVPGFDFSGVPESRQVGMLQVVRPVPLAPIQRFIYGITQNPMEQDDTRATNLRAVSVWPEEDPLDTRIVVCGESYDEQLPLSQTGNIGGLASGTNANGFLMVFDGTGTLLFTHHFPGATGVWSSAVTDVAVRVVTEDETMVEDVITFCGITSHGNPMPNGELTTPLASAFAAPGATACSLPAGGAQDNGAGQWDGFVGRLVRPHNAGPVAGAEVLEFLSVVGGAQQDGLFGIDESSEERFVVVGSTATGGAAGPGPFTFPLTNGACLGTAGQYCLGVVMSFDATATPAAPLILDGSESVGQLDAEPATHTVFRDVVVQRNFNFGGANDAYAVVGSTDDDMALATVSIPGPDPVLSGMTDGLVLVCVDDPSAGIGLLSGSYHGGDGDDGLTGVRSWNEFDDHFSVVGFTDRGPVGTGVNFDVGSYFHPNSTGAMQALTSGQISGGGFDLPTAVGPINATLTLVWQDFALGGPAGGGIAIDERSRVNVVGTTSSTDYPFLGGGLAPEVPGFEAVRTTLDLLPVNATGLGVGRTDGTGPAVPAPFGPFPIAGFTGGTSPFCALTAFGDRIGRAVPVLPRMNIDFLGDAAAGAVGTAILVSRPTPGATLNLTALQFGFPNTTPPFFSLPDGLEVWTTDPSTVVFPVGVSIDQPLVFPLASPLPAGAVRMTAQLLCFQPAATIPGGNPFSATPCLPVANGNGSGSPALWIDY